MRDRASNTRSKPPKHNMIIKLAKTSKTESSEDNAFIHQEYRLKRISQNEYTTKAWEHGKDVSDQGYLPVMLERRTVQTVDGVEKLEDWELFDFSGKAAQLLLDKNPGTAFVSAESLHNVHVNAQEPPAPLPENPLDAIVKIVADDREGEGFGHWTVYKIEKVLALPRPAATDNGEAEKLRIELEQMKAQLNQTKLENQQLKEEIERLTPPNGKPPKSEPSNNVVNLQGRREQKLQAAPVSQVEQVLIEIVQAQSECFGSDVQALLQENCAVMRDILAEQKPKQTRKPKQEKKPQPIPQQTKPRRRRKKDKVVEGQIPLFDFSQFAQLSLFAV